MNCIYENSIKAKMRKSYHRPPYLVLEKLVFETFVIGYPLEGETIVFYIKCDSVITFAGVVDAYIRQNSDQLESVLQELGDKKLDIIIWTHPDTDHTTGLMEVLRKYTSKETRLWVPETVFDTGESFSQTACKVVNSVFESITESDGPIFRISTASDFKDLLYYDSLVFVHNLEEFPLQISTYSPISEELLRRSTNKIANNDYSIVFSLHLGDFVIVYTGDAQNATFEQIPAEKFPSNIDIIKIPHHGSSSSSKCINLINGLCEYACSTVYRKGRSSLPEKKIMSLYRGKAKSVSCTGKMNHKDENCDFGIIQIVVDVLKRDFEIAYSGNAEEWLDSIS